MRVFDDGHAKLILEYGIAIPFHGGTMGRVFMGFIMALLLEGSTIGYHGRLISGAFESQVLILCEMFFVGTALVHLNRVNKRGSGVLQDAD